MLKKLVFISSENLLDRVSSLTSTVFRAWVWDGLLVTLQATIQNEVQRKPEFPLLSLATGLGLVESLVASGPGYVTTAAWGANYPESTAVICPSNFSNFMLEDYEIAQK